MEPARAVRLGEEHTRLLDLRARAYREPIAHRSVHALDELLSPGDLLIVNRSGTVPSSLHARTSSGERCEIRLASFLGPSPRELKHWNGVLFGAGDWRDPTERRGRAPTIALGENLYVSDGLSARVTHVDALSPRLVRVELVGLNILEELYRHGRPIQYSYLNAELNVEAQQTLFAGPAVSVEPPSASFPLTWELVLRLRAQNVELASVLHSAGLSSTGEEALDARLPLSEWFDVPKASAEAIGRAHHDGRRIVALGTSVVRAVESAVTGAQIEARSGVTTLRIGPSRPPRIVNALISGIHERGTSHLELVRTFGGVDGATDVLNRGYREARALGYRTHEYGDLSLIM